MATIKRKTKKKITKQVAKLVRKHGGEIATGLVSSLVAGVVASFAVSGDAGRSKKRKRAAEKPELSETPKATRKSNKSRKPV